MLLGLRLFRDRSFTVANIVGLTFSFGILGTVFILIRFLQVVQGYSPLEAGVLPMPWTLAPMFIAPPAGLLAPRLGTRTFMITGLGLMAGGMFLPATTLRADVAYLVMVPGFLAAGIGKGLVFAPMSTAVLANMHHNDHAKASGANATHREVGVALGVAVLTAVFTGAGGQLAPTGYVDAAIPAVFVGAAVLVMAVAAALWLRSRNRPSAPDKAARQLTGSSAAAHAVQIGGPQNRVRRSWPARDRVRRSWTEKGRKGDFRSNFCVLDPASSNFCVLDPPSSPQTPVQSLPRSQARVCGQNESR